MTETRTEWGARFNRYDGTEKYENTGGDREHAEFTADSVTTYLESLNEPTRRLNGVEYAEVVSRTVAVEDDGTRIIRPWRLERPGVVVR